MNKSLYPESVEVHQRTLEYTESSKAAGINELAVDATTRGVLSGLAVTVTAFPNDTRIDVAAGSGYAPNGEFMALGVAQIGQQLVDQTLGGVNYVLLVYDELLSLPESHETDGSTRNTRATVSPRVAVLNASQYAALSATDPILTNNALDRALVLATVVGNGVSVALTGGSITTPTHFTNALQATQPVNITGTAITFLDPTTALGTGTLSYTASTHTITWQAPGEGSPGSGVVLTTSIPYTLTSSGGKQLIIDVSYTLLPVTNKTDSIVVVNIYNQSIPRFSAEDFLHRTYIGSGIPTIKNPHGLTIGDLSPTADGTLEEHQNLEHANGIVRSSSASLLSCIVNPAPAPDELDVTAFSANDFLYVHGHKVTSINGSNIVSFASASTNVSTYGIYITRDGALIKSLRVQYPNVGVSLLFDKTQIANISENIGAGTKNLVWTSGGQISFDGGLSKTAPSVDTMMRLFSADEVSYVDVFVKGSATPGSTQTDIMTFFTQQDLTQVFQLCYLPWAGSAAGFLGLGFSAGNSPNNVFDKRLYGTTSPNNMRDDAGFVNVAQETFELHGDGIYVRNDLQTSVSAGYADQFAMGTLSGVTIPVKGGIAYVGGNRFEVPTTTITVTNNQTNYIYVNYLGQMATSFQSQAQILAAQNGRPLLFLWSETLSGGSETSRSDLRVYTGQRRNAPLGVVALDVNTAANWTSTGSADALTVTSTAGKGVFVTVSGGSANAVRINNSGSGIGLNVVNGSGIGATITSTGNFGAEIGTTAAGIAALFAISTAGPAVQALAGTNATNGQISIQGTGGAGTGSGVGGTGVKGIGGNAAGSGAAGIGLYGQAGTTASGAAGQGVLGVGSAGTGTSLTAGEGGFFQPGTAATANIPQYALTTYQGHIQINAAYPASGQIFANPSVTSSNVPMVLANFTGQTAPLALVTIAQNSGYNIGSVTQDAGGSITVFFASGVTMPNTSYVCQITMENGWVTTTTLVINITVRNASYVQFQTINEPAGTVRTNLNGVVYNVVIYPTAV